MNWWIIAFCHVFLHVFYLHIFLVVVQGSKMDAWCWRVLAHLHMDMNNNNEFFLMQLKGSGQRWNRKGFLPMMYSIEMNIIVHIPDFETFSSLCQKHWHFFCLCCYPKWKYLLLHCQIWKAYWVVMESCCNIQRSYNRHCHYLHSCFKLL